MSRARRSASRVDRYDLVVVGGTGGLVSSLVAAGIGARMALVERARMGGDCLWTGCVPSQSLLVAADLAHRMRHAAQVGLVACEPVVDFAQVMAHVDDARRAIAPQDSVERLQRERSRPVRGPGTDLCPWEAAAVSQGDHRDRFAGRRCRRSLVSQKPGP